MRKIFIAALVRNSSNKNFSHRIFFHFIKFATVKNNMERILQSITSPTSYAYDSGYGVMITSCYRRLLETKNK